MLLGMGNPLLDILATVDTSFLEKYNLKPNNAILADESHKALIPDMVKNFQVDYIAGGSVQNTLRIAQVRVFDVSSNIVSKQKLCSYFLKICQWILRKPNVAAFFGCVGRDSNSEILAKKAREAGINAQYQYSDSHSTGELLC